jgi:phosphoribulokinase
MDQGPSSIAPRVAAGAHRPLLLALAGDSASGKSTLSRGVEFILGVERVARVCTDDYHRFDRAARAERGVTPLAPEANDMRRMAADLRTLAGGTSVVKPTYDHHTGTFGADETVAPGQIVIVEGLLPLADRAVRDEIDVAVFLEPEEDLRHRWKLDRDVFERGYSPKEVVAELKRREPDAAQYIRPQRDYADVIVRFHRREGATDDEHLSARLVVRPTLPFPALREVLGSFRSRGVDPVRWSTRTDRRGPMSVLEIDGNCPPGIGAELEEALWASLHPDEQVQWDRIGMVRRPGETEERSESLALVQLLIVTYLVGAFDQAFEL